MIIKVLPKKTTFSIFTNKTGVFYEKIFLIGLSLVSSVFADIIYLRNGQEVKDATVTEIGVSDVKYKVDKREVIYTVRKSDIAIIFYKDGSKEVFESDPKSEHFNSAGQMMMQATPQQNIQNTVIVNGANAASGPTQDKYENFTTGQRWGTWALNALTINGLGSWLIMGDGIGGFVHLGIGITSILLLVNAPTYEVCDDHYGGYGGYSYNECYEEPDPTLFLIAYFTGAAWNIYRSVNHDKPRNVASTSKYGSFNMAVLPNRNGNLATHLMYNKSF